MVGGLMRLLFSSVLAWVAGSGAVAHAQGLGDPTRPAIGEGASVAGETGKTRIDAPAGLQSIIRRKGARPAAIVNGQLVELGGKVGESKLVQINDGDIVLQGPAGREEMKLTPAVEKTTPVLPQTEQAEKESGHQSSRGKKTRK